MRWVCVCMCICVILMHLIETHTLMNILGGISMANRRLSSQTKLNYVVVALSVHNGNGANELVKLCAYAEKIRIKCKFLKYVVADWDRYCVSFEESLSLMIGWV